MRQRHSLTRTLIVAAAGAACLAITTPAAAADPRGANGTVKIDGPAYQLDNRNEPHVTCEFQVEFFNFDNGEQATIILAAQPPSSKDFHEVGRLENQLVSTDAARGGAFSRDADEVFRFSVSDLNLTEADAHDKQGYHLKLTVDRQNHPEWTEKHKVFWVKPCPPAGMPSSSPQAPGSSGGQAPGDQDNASGGEGGSSLPITGPAAGGIALAGLALVGGGATLLFLRRRREKVTFTA